MKPGDSFYFNAIAGSINMIEYMKGLVREGKIAPDKEELDRVIFKDAQEKFLKGEALAPQMVYIVRGAL